MSRAIEQMIEALFEKGRDEYRSGFVSSYKRALYDRGHVDGLFAAAGSNATVPDSDELKKAAEEYASIFISGYKRGLKIRGDQDGLDAAVAAPVDAIKPKPIASEASGDG